MAYHFDPFTKEPTRCTFAYGACPVAPVMAHYGNISEAVEARLRLSAAATTASPLLLNS